MQIYEIILFQSWLMKKRALEHKEKAEGTGSLPASGQGEPNGTGENQEPKLVIPHLARVETRSYKPGINSSSSDWFLKTSQPH